MEIQLTSTMTTGTTFYDLTKTIKTPLLRQKLYRVFNAMSIILLVSKLSDRIITNTVTLSGLSISSWKNHSKYKVTKDKVQRTIEPLELEFPLSFPLMYSHASLVFSAPKGRVFLFYSCRCQWHRGMVDSFAGSLLTSKSIMPCLVQANSLTRIKKGYSWFLFQN